jgi:hypothetical protein
MEALGGAGERTNLATSGAVVADGVEAFAFASATTRRTGTAGDGILVRQGAVGELCHSVVRDDLEMGSRI